MRLRSTLAAIAALALLATPVFAAGPFAQVDTGSTSVNFTPAVSGYALTLTVSGPEGFRYEQTYDAGQAATFSIFDVTGDFVPGGKYTWELRAVPALSDSERTAMDELRATGADAASLTKAGKLPRTFEPMSGTFTIEQGAIVTGGEAEASPGGGNRLATKAQVFSTDLIVQGSACVGVDCTTSESFGFDTLRLKENNLRIKYQDTSSSGSFPTADWELRGNDSGNGGENYWAVVDIDAGSQLAFKVEQGAGNNALVVNSNGNIGIDTVDPAVKIHAVDGNTPTLRLQQDGSAGFQQQIYDVGANEANFFVRDVTNGSRLAFRMKPGAPENSLYVAANGDVGLGTQNPSEDLHVRGTDGATAMRIEEASTTAATRTMLTLANNGGSRLDFENSAGQGWRVSATGNFNVDFDYSGSLLRVAQFKSNGDLEIPNGQIITSTGNTCASGCDRVFSPDYELPTIKEHAAEMYANSYLPAVGPTPEEADAPFNMTEKFGGMLNELEKAHIFIAQLNDEIQDRDRVIEDLSERLARVESLLATEE